jgi:hypothetical protein
MTTGAVAEDAEEYSEYRQNFHVGEQFTSNRAKIFASIEHGCRKVVRRGVLRCLAGWVSATRWLLAMSASSTGRKGATPDRCG